MRLSTGLAFSLFWIFISVPLHAQIAKDCIFPSRHAVAENRCPYAQERFEYMSYYKAIDPYGPGKGEKKNGMDCLKSESAYAPYEIK